MERGIAVSPRLDRPRIYRQVSFDKRTFDLFQEAKRCLSSAKEAHLTNSEVLRMLLLSHPFCNGSEQGATNGGH